MEKKLGYYSVLASFATSVLIVILFYVLAQGTNPEMYRSVDVYAGMVYVFILSMIVSASIWPGIIEKRLQKHLHADGYQDH